VETLYDSLERAVKANPNSRALGHRPIDSNGEAGDYEWINYTELQGHIPGIFLFALFVHPVE